MTTSSSASKPTLADRDPSGSAGGLITMVAAALTLAVAFGLELSADQEKAILGFVATAGPALTAWLIRRRAFAPTTVRALLKGDTTPQLQGLEVEVAVIPATDTKALEAALLEQAAEEGGEVGLAEEDLEQLGADDLADVDLADDEEQPQA